MFGPFPGWSLPLQRFFVIQQTRSPFTRNGIFPFGGRSTAIKMKSGGVWLLASTPLEPETKDKLNALGPVQ
jgi:hypothetical protein